MLNFILGFLVALPCYFLFFRWASKWLMKKDLEEYHKAIEKSKRRKMRHDGDCTFYASMANGRPEDGICTCGYARDALYYHDPEQHKIMYSEERLKTIKCPHDKHALEECSECEDFMDEFYKMLERDK